MRAFLNGFVHEARRLVLTPKYVVMLLLLLLMSWVTTEIYQGLVIRDVPVVVFDRDGSGLSRTLRRYIDATREVEVVQVPISSVEGAQALLTRGEVAAVVLIPSSFSTDLKHGREPRVLVAIDGSNIVIAKNVSKAISTAIGTVSAGVQITVARKLGLPEEKAMAAVVPITVDENDVFNPATNYAVYIVPAATFFLLHVYAMLLFASVFLPDDPSPGIAHRAGRMVAIGLTSFLLGVAFFVLLMPHAHVTVQSSLGVASVVLAAFLVVEALFVAALARVLPGPMFAFQATIILNMLALMFSGITWPMDMFPQPLQLLAACVPFTPFAHALRMFIHEPLQLEQLHGPLLQLGQQALVFTVLIAAGRVVRRTIPALRRRFA
jgi:ABC-2 type transport system permease protein